MKVSLKKFKEQIKRYSLMFPNASEKEVQSQILFLNLDSQDKKVYKEQNKKFVPKNFNKIQKKIIKNGRF